MGTKNYLIDTNILIYHFADKIPANEADKIKSIFKKSLNISIVTKVEFLGWKNHTESGFKKAVKFIKHSNVIYNDKQIADKAIEIRRKRSIKLADALIAATALDGNYTLITRNVDDFKNLKIKIYNPFKS